MEPTAAAGLRVARRVQRTLLVPLLRFVLPSHCFVCGEELLEFQRAGACLACWVELRPLRPPLCPGCALPRPSTTDLLGPARGRCARCVVSPPAVATVRAAVAYDEAARRFLLRAKIGLRRELLPTLGAQLCSLARGWAPAHACTEIVPVPSHPWTELRRGFSPAGELARPLARMLGIPVRRRRIRRRFFGGMPAKRLGARQRIVLARGSFRAPGEMPGARILLVDDVMTSGATIEACARALRRAGACEVRAVVWARTLPGHPAAPSSPVRA